MTFVMVSSGYSARVDNVLDHIYPCDRCHRRQRHLHYDFEDFRPTSTLSSPHPVVILIIITRRQDGRVVKALDFNAVTRVQIPLWPLAGVVPGKCLVQLLGHSCK